MTKGKQVIFSVFRLLYSGLVVVVGRIEVENPKQSTEKVTHDLLGAHFHSRITLERLNVGIHWRNQATKLAIDLAFSDYVRLPYCKQTRHWSE